MGASCSAPERACCSPTSSCQRTANHLAKDPERLALAIGQSLAKDPANSRRLGDREAGEDDEGRRTADSGKPSPTTTAATASLSFSLSSTAGSEEASPDSPESQASTRMREALLVSIDERHRIAASSDESKHRRRQRRRQQQLEKKRAEGLPGLPEYDDDELGDPFSDLNDSTGDELGGSCSDDMEDATPPPYIKTKTAGFNRTMTTSVSPSTSTTTGRFSSKVSSFAKTAFSRDATFHEGGGRRSITNLAASGLPMLPGKRTLSRAMSKVHAPGSGLARAFSAGAGLARGMSGYVEGGKMSKQFSRSGSIAYIQSVGVVRAGSSRLRRLLSRAKSKSTMSGDSAEPEGAGAPDSFADPDDAAPTPSKKTGDPFKRGMSVMLAN